MRGGGFRPHACHCAFQGSDCFYRLQMASGPYPIRHRLLRIFISFTDAATAAIVRFICYLHFLPFVRCLSVSFDWMLLNQKIPHKRRAHIRQEWYENQISWIKIWFLYVFIVMRLFTPAELLLDDIFFSRFDSHRWLAYRYNKSVTDSRTWWGKYIFILLAMLPLVA